MDALNNIAIFEEELRTTIARSMAEQQDAVLGQAINRHLGHQEWAMGDILPRLKLWAIEGTGWETVALDGRPILEMGPLEFSNQTQHGNTSHIINHKVSRKYRVLTLGPDL